MAQKLPKKVRKTAVYFNGNSRRPGQYSNLKPPKRKSEDLTSELASSVSLCKTAIHSCKLLIVDAKLNVTFICFKLRLLISVYFIPTNCKYGNKY